MAWLILIGWAIATIGEELEGRK